MKFMHLTRKEDREDRVRMPSHHKITGDRDVPKPESETDKQGLILYRFSYLIPFNAKD